MGTTAPEREAGRGGRPAVLAVAGNVLLATLFAGLAVAHVDVARRTGRWGTALPIVAQEALLVALFLTRRRAIATSSRPRDWVIGITGAFLPLLLRPTEPEGNLSSIGQPVQVVALALAFAGASSLGRSIGLVPANRGVRTAGLYRAVRHPMYAACLMSYAGYVVSYPSPSNALITVVTLITIVLRASYEERLLAHEPAYREYVRRVPWRFVPYVY
jgi:protein-S-isoprenylcysteine O-methyltransferase Ste14